jgi:hypothetical protein
VLDRGSAVRKHGYYFHLAMARVAQNRFRVDETDLDNARRSLAAAQEAEEKDVGYATFFLARFLLLHGDLAEAQDHLEHSLAMAERIGETGLLAYSLQGLAMAALRRHDTAAVRALVPPGPGRGGDHSRPRLPGRGQGLPGLAGLAGPAPGRRDQAGGGDHDADDGHPRRGALLWPRPPVAAGRRAPGGGHLAEAVAATRRLRDHMQFPAGLEAALTAASQAWDQDQPDLARDHLAAALDQARDLGYF